MQQFAVLCLDGVDLGQVVFAARNQFSKLLVCLADGASWRGRGEGVSVSAGNWRGGGGGWWGGTHIAFSSSSSIEASDSNCDIFAANRLLTYSVGAHPSASAQFQRRSLPTPSPACTIAMSQSHLRGVQRFLRLHAGGCCCGCCSPAFLLRRWRWGCVRGRRVVVREVVGCVGGGFAVHRGLPVVRGVVDGSHGGGDVCEAECGSRGGGNGVSVTAGTAGAAGVQLRCLSMCRSEIRIFFSLPLPLFLLRTAKVRMSL